MSTKELTAEERQEAEKWLQDIFDRLTVERILKEIEPATLMAQFAPEQRLAGLDMQDLVAALPVAALQSMADSYINSLAPHVQQKIRQRLRDETH
ncbi:MAG TPA: hypothetical protein PKA58_13645 [Polyangium sp.]|nr:hypothetical protein [Polyangium sp.]